MNVQVAICADETACRNPGAIGLDGENLDAHGWLAVYPNGGEARKGITLTDSIEEAWVISSDDVEPINLAASLKSDRPELRVYLISTDQCGSLYSRAHTARIDGVLDQNAFIRRYLQVKAELGRLNDRLGMHAATGKDAAGEIAESAVKTYRNQTQTDNRPQSQSQGYLQTDTPHAGIAAKGQAATQTQPGFQGSTPVSASPWTGSGFSGTSSPVLQWERDGLPPKPPATGTLSQSQPRHQPIAAQPAGHLLQLQTPPSTLSALPTQQRRDGREANRAYLLPVVSGSGGAGKSAVAALGALIAQRRGLKTLLFDCDLQFGDTAHMVGAGNPLAIDEAIANPEKLAGFLNSTAMLSVLSAPARLEMAEQVVAYLPQLIDRLHVSFDTIIVNTGSTWADQHALLLERSSAALFLIDQRTSSVHACQHALELCARCGIATGPFRFAVNKCTKNAPLTSIDVSCALRGAQVFELKDGGRDVEECLGSGMAGELIDSRNEFAKSLEHVLGQLLPASPRKGTNPIAAPDQERTPKRRARHAGRKRGRVAL